MLKSKQRAFTLLEIIIVVGISGIIAVGALAPLSYTVRSLNFVQKQWHTQTSIERCVNRIFFEAKHTIPIYDASSVRIECNEESMVDGKQGVLYMWCGSAAEVGESPYLVVYKYVGNDASAKNKTGVYCWKIRDIRGFLSQHDNSYIISNPNLVLSHMLKAEDGKLVLPNVKGIIFSVPSGTSTKWKSSYSGNLPSVLRIEILTGEKNYVYENRFIFSQ